MRVIAASDRAFKAAVKKVVSRSNFHGGKIESAVRTILKSVERGGDTAVSRYTKDHIAVSGGLQSGETVVSAGVQMLRPGQKVEIAAETKR